MVAELRIGATRDHVPDALELIVSSLRVDARMIAEPQARSRILAGAAEGDVVDHRITDCRHAADPLHHFAPHEHAAARGAGYVRAVVENRRERIERGEEV